MRGISYSQFIAGLIRAGVELDRKMLSEIAIHDPASFDQIVTLAKQFAPNATAVKKGLAKQHVLQLDVAPRAFPFSGRRSLFWHIPHHNFLLFISTSVIPAGKQDNNLDEVIPSYLLCRAKYHFRSVVNHHGSRL